MRAVQQIGRLLCWPLAVILLLAIGVGPARSDDAVTNIPRLEGITIDGDGSDWGDRGFQVNVLPDDQGALCPADDLDATLRLGWNEEGLLVLVTVRDGVASEEGEIWNGDSVELFVGENASGSSYYQFIVSPGRDPDFPTPRVQPWDYRADKSVPLTCTAKTSATEAGYTVEVLLPWAPFPLKPSVGKEVSFQIFMNDSDAPGDRFQGVWYPRSREGAVSRASHVLRLAETASTPEVIVSNASYERMRRTRVSAVGRIGLVGKPVELRDSTKMLAKTVFTDDHGHAAAVLETSLPSSGQPAPELLLLVDGKDAGIVTLPDLGQQRAQLLLETPFNFHPYLTGMDTFPQCDFDQPNYAEDLLGRYTIKTTYYDSDYNQVTKTDKLGRYGAVIQITPEYGRPVTLFRSVYRVPFVEGVLFLPRDTGVRIAYPSIPYFNQPVVAEQQAVIGDVFWGAFSAGLNHDPATAAVFSASLGQAQPTGRKATVQDDLLAQDRQWWVGLKRKLYGLEEQYPTPFVCPRPIEGKPAPALHEGTPAEAGMKPDAPQKIDALLQEWAAKSDEGFQACVARHGVVILNKAYGQRDNRPMTLNDKSWMASITKLLSATLLMTVVDQGRVSLDDPVDKFLPAFRGVEVKQPLTIRHLYTHTGGTWGHWGDELHDFDQLIGSYYPYLAVGKEFSYNGAGFALGGKIIEAVSGEAIPLFYKHHLLDPLGCGNTDVFGTSWDASSTALDIAKVGQLLLNKGAYGDMRFFSEATFQQMLPERLTKVLGPDATMDRGIGMYSFDGEGLSKATFGHGAASSATLWIDPVNDLVITMTRNRAGTNFDTYHPRYLKAIVDGIAD